MTQVVGVDGCRNGWVAVTVTHEHGLPSFIDVRFLRRFGELLQVRPGPAVIAIDMPIGLLDSKRDQGRACDVQARKLLGARASSIFAAPLRSNLYMQTFQIGMGISQQTFNIQPKVLEVDKVMSPDLQKRVYEVHPELSFLTLAGRPLTEKKSLVVGRQERLNILRPIFAGVAETVEKACTPRRKADGMTVQPDDVIDAFAAAWTAMRISLGQAQYAGDGERDSKGLLMQIWY